ncbi:hypothetical protein PF003_g29122 [Phytophthora fragariae]|nr:hypothetical protein PF003_g29122 [Phytophthora fragariae]
MRMHASLLLVRPEDFLSSSPWHPDQHAYVRVLSTQPDHVVVQDFPGSMHQEYLDRNKRPAESSDINARPAQRRALGMEISAPPASDAFERSQPGTNFRPTTLQQAVHGLIVHPDYTGKTPSENMQLMLSSSAAGINPHPAILMKLFDLAFGIRGLSSANLERFDLSAQRQWRREGVNMNNFATSVDLPRPRSLSTMAELFEAFSLLQAFGMRFYNATTQAFITAAMGFAATITGMGMWNASAVDLITFWFDGVLDDYLRAIEEMVVSGVDNRDNIRQRLTKSDPDFFNTMHLIHSEASAPAAKDQGRSDRSATKRSPAESKQTRVLQDIIAALPSQNGKSVCLKFLTRAGCPSRSPKRCMFGRAHFIPEKLEPVVRQYINDNMGGIRRDIPPDQ